MGIGAMGIFDTEAFSSDHSLEKAEWRRKAWSIPDLRGGKRDWFALTLELLTLVGGRAGGGAGQLSSGELCPKRADMARVCPVPEGHGAGRKPVRRPGAD